jgi:hypothetical protein
VRLVYILKQRLRLLRLLIAHRHIVKTIRGVRGSHLTYLRIEDLCDLVELVLHYERQKTPGIIIEAGCAAGGSAITLASAKTPDRAFFVYDVFGMIPPPSSKDGGDVHGRYQDILAGQSQGIGDTNYYGYEPNLYDKVQQRFADFNYPVKANNIHLVKGLYADTLTIDQPVVLAHIDCDWYESVMTCLKEIEPHLVQGGTFIIDDYDTWSGCKSAVDDYFADKHAEYTFLKHGRLHIVKNL